jgi:hypothetical protein
MQSKEKRQPPCLLAHALLNKLSAIVGYSDLLLEKVEKEEGETECVKRLKIIHALAASAAKDLSDHQCQLSSVVRSLESREAASTAS